MSYRGDGGTVILSSGPDRRRSYRGAPATVAYRFSIRFSRAYRWWGSRALVGATGRMATSCIRSPSLREGGEDAYQGPIMPRGDAARNLVRPCGPDRPPPAGFRGSNTARVCNCPGSPPPGVTSIRDGSAPRKTLRLTGLPGKPNRVRCAPCGGPYWRLDRLFDFFDECTKGGPYWVTLPREGGWRLEHELNVRSSKTCNDNPRISMVRPKYGSGLKGPGRRLTSAFATWHDTMRAPALPAVFLSTSPFSDTPRATFGP